MPIFFNCFLPIFISVINVPVKFWICFYDIKIGLLETHLAFECNASIELEKQNTKLYPFEITENSPFDYSRLQLHHFKILTSHSMIDVMPTQRKTYGLCSKQQTLLQRKCSVMFYELASNDMDMCF